MVTTTNRARDRSRAGAGPVLRAGSTPVAGWTERFGPPPGRIPDLARIAGIVVPAILGLLGLALAGMDPGSLPAEGPLPGWP